MSDIYQEITPPDVALGQIYKGVVNRPPSKYGDSMDIMIPDMHPDLVFPDVPWVQGGNDNLPSPGDTVLVIFDNNNEPWVATWWDPNFKQPVSPLPPRLMDGTNANHVNDANEARSSGWYHSGQGNPNNPQAGYPFNLLVTSYTQNQSDVPNAVVEQIAFNCYYNEIWLRRVAWDVWQPWVKIFGTGATDDTQLPGRLQTVGPSITDCNAVYDSGWYRLNNGVNQPAGYYPYGFLFCMNWGSGNNGQTFQMYHPMYTDAVFWRRSTNYAWQPWHQIWPVEDAALRTTIRQFADTNQSDCNNMTQNGWYEFNRDAANRPPIVGEFMMETLALNPGYIVQVAYYLYDAKNIFVRNGGSGGWTGWTQISPIGDATLPPRIASLSMNTLDLNNTQQQNGWYFANYNSVNLPPTGPVQWYVHQIMWGSPGYGVQIAYSLYGNEIWWRNMQGSVWQGWLQLSPIPAGAITVNDTNLPARIQSHAWPALTDCNQQLGSGWYWVSSGSANAPTGDHGKLLVCAMNDPRNCLQVWQSYTVDDMYIRRQQEYNWGPWIQVYPASVGDNNLPQRLNSKAAYYGFAYDANQMPNGWSQYWDGWPNYPGGYGLIFSLQTDPNGAPGNDVGRQIAYRYENDSFYMRRRIGVNNWSAWYPAAPWMEGTQVPRLANAAYPNNIINDCNLATANGWYYVQANAANKPPPGYADGTIRVDAYNPGWLTQVFNDTSTLNVEYRRQYQASTGWTPWVRTFYGADANWKSISSYVGWQNGWYGYGAPYGDVYFRRMPDGFVEFVGIAVVGSSTRCLQMPVGYRPATPGTLIIHTANSQGKADETFRLNSDGTLDSSVTPGAWVSFVGFRYLAEN